MEVTYRTTQLRTCYEHQKEAQKAWGKVVARKYVQRIDELKACPTIQDVRNLSALRLHKLTGHHEGKHAIVLHDRWRLIITFEEETVPQQDQPAKGDMSGSGQGAPVRVHIEEVTPHYGD